MSAPAPSTPHGAPTELDRYIAIQAFAELELELAGRGEVEELVSHTAGWDALTADLPPDPPPAARSLLESATLLHERARIELLRIREALLSELAEVGHVSRAAHGYAPSADRRPRVDRSA